MPLSGMIQMLNMQINTWFGGVGVGWMNYFAFMIIAVFISGLMVGRTPEFLCKKVEAREMKIASIVALLHPFVILVGTALACYLFVYAPSFVEGEGGWVNNPGFHGLSEFLYEYTSSAANNGSGFEGLSDNTWFWNYSCGIVLILSRFHPDRRTGCHCRASGGQEVYSRDVRNVEDRFSDIQHCDFCRDFHRCGFVLLPCPCLEHHCRTFEFVNTGQNTLITDNIFIYFYSIFWN